MFSKRKNQSQMEIDSKFKVGFSVSYKINEFETIPGHIHRVYLNEQGEIRYDVQVGGECPYIKKSIKEEDIRFR